MVFAEPIPCPNPTREFLMPKISLTELKYEKNATIWCCYYKIAYNHTYLVYFLSREISTCELILIQR